MFIVFEGIDGSGKTTQAKSLKLELENKGLKVNYFREPGGTELGEKIRETVLNEEMSPRAELLLFLSSRAELVDRQVLPKLENKEIVILDRYIDSSIVYQGGIRGLGYDNVFKTCMFATNYLVPSITFYIDVNPEIAYERIRFKKQDKFESVGKKLLEDARNHYLHWYKHSPHKAIIIDGNNEVVTIKQQILDYYSLKSSQYNSLRLW